MPHHNGVLAELFPCVCFQDLATSLIVEELELEQAQCFAPIDWCLDLLGLDDGCTMLPQWTALVGVLEGLKPAALEWLTLAAIDGLSQTYEAAMVADRAVAS